MLNLDDPRSNHVFAAARQEDMILDACKTITVSAPRERVAHLELVRPCFAGLRWLNRERFGDSPDTAAGIDLWEQAVEALAALPLLDPSPTSGCPVCGGKLSRPSREPRAYCPACLNLIMHGLDLIRSSFGTEWI